MTRLEQETMYAVKHMAGSLSRMETSLELIANALDRINRNMTPKQEGGATKEDETQDKRQSMRDAARNLIDAIRHVA